MSRPGTLATAAALSCLLLLVRNARADEPPSVVATGCTNVIVDANAPASPSTAPVCPPTSAPTPAPKTRERWYGWQTLVTDGAAIAMLGAAGSGSDEQAQKMLLLGSLATYVLGGPLVHAAHERGGAAGASVGLRLGAPIAGTLLGMGFGSAIGDGNDYAPLIYGALGFVGGIITASVIDSAVIARERITEEPKAALRVTPAVAPTRGGATFGAAATF